MRETVSVIVPFFNRVDCVLRCAASIEKQDYSALQVLIIDDGSNECTKKIESFCSQRKGWKFIRHGKNLGVSYARNTGLKFATGKWIAFLDSDDLWLENKISTQLFFMAKNSLLASHTNYLRRSNIGTATVTKEVNAGKFSYKMPWILFSCRIATPTVMVHSNIIKDLKFDTSISHMEDQLFWSRISQRCVIVGIELTTTIVNVNENSSALKLNKYILGMRFLRDKFLKTNILLFGLHSFYSYIVFIMRKYVVKHR